MRKDAKFSASFDEVFRAEGIRVIRTPVRAPNANAFAERWVCTVRSECLDWILVLGRRQLERVLRTYVRHYNEHRPHGRLDLRPPIHSAKPIPHRAGVGGVRRQDILGGLINEYEAVA